MKLVIENREYPIIIERKRTNKNTYLRVKPDLSILITTNLRTKEKDFKKLLEDNYKQICKMISRQQNKNEINEQFYFLGKKYDIIYWEQDEVKLGGEKVFLSHNTNLDKWYKKEAQEIFKEHLDYIYNIFSEKIPYPDLRIRKMTSRWGVCNTKEKIVTLNLELIKRDTKYLDYVIIHELSHLVYPNHSKYFWEIVGKNLPNYKMLRKEMKEF